MHAHTHHNTKENKQKHREKQKSDVPTVSAFNHNYVKLTGWRLGRSHFYGMFVKKVLLSWRHRLISVVQLILPVLFTVLALLIDTDAG